MACPYIINQKLQTRFSSIENPKLIQTKSLALNNKTKQQKIPSKKKTPKIRKFKFQQRTMPQTNQTIPINPKILTINRKPNINTEKIPLTQFQATQSDNHSQPQHQESIILLPKKPSKQVVMA